MQGVSCRFRFECGIIFPTLCLTPKRWMGYRMQSNIGCYPELCFLQFSVAQTLVGLRKHLKTIFFPTVACPAGFNNNNNNNNNDRSIFEVNPLVNQYAQNLQSNVRLPVCFRLLPWNSSYGKVFHGSFCVSQLNELASFIFLYFMNICRVPRAFYFRADSSFFILPPTVGTISGKGKSVWKF